MQRDVVIVRIDPSLRLFLPPRLRHGDAVVTLDGTSTLGHVVQSLGVPLTEVGRLLLGGRPVPASHRPGAGDVVDVEPVSRPQAAGTERFLLDVHLGALARRLRLVGVDTAYSNIADDDALVAAANAERRLLLTKDRGLLQRRALWRGAYVHGTRPDDQLHDVLDRFAPRLAPWTRCTACNATVDPIPKARVVHLLQPGTQRTYDEFARCRACGRVYWHGAHGDRLARIVAAATGA